MKFCPECAHPVTLEEGRGGHASRYRCTRCNAIFHQSPRLATGCIAEWEGRILLCRRGVAPGYGLWELPAGFVAEGESAAAAAVRETLEEANVGVELQRVYALINIPHVNQMRVIWLARLAGADVSPGAETLETRLFDEAGIPWSSLAFATTRDPLSRYFQDRRKGTLGFFFADIVPFEAGRA